MRLVSHAVPGPLRGAGRRAYRDSVLPPSVEAARGRRGGARRWAGTAGSGDRGAVVAMHGFGASAPAEALYEHFGFTGEKVAEARQVLHQGQP